MLNPEQALAIASKLELVFKQVGYREDDSIYAKGWKKLPFNTKCRHRFIAKGLHMHAVIKKNRLESCAKRKIAEGYVSHGASIQYKSVIYCANPSCGLVFKTEQEATE